MRQPIGTVLSLAYGEDDNQQLVLVDSKEHPEAADAIPPRRRMVVAGSVLITYWCFRDWLRIPVQIPVCFSQGYKAKPACVPNVRNEISPEANEYRDVGLNNNVVWGQSDKMSEWTGHRSFLPRTHPLRSRSSVNSDVSKCVVARCSDRNEQAAKPYIINAQWPVIGYNEWRRKWVGDIYGVVL